MRGIRQQAVVAAGSVAFALALYLLMALPGVLSDHDSTVSLRPTHEARR